MTTGRSWQEIKAEAHRLHPELGDPGRQARARAELDSYVAGHHLQELRKAIWRTQAEVARILGVFPVPGLPNRERRRRPWDWTRCAPMPPPSADTSTSPSTSAPTR
jgi:hypothetical protein